MRFAVLNFGVQYQTQVGDPVRVNGMARSPRLGRVVADLGPVLMSIEQLDRRVGIENPARGKRLARALCQRIAHPLRALGQLGFADRTALFRTTLERRRQMRQTPAQAFVADDLGHAENLRRHRIASQSRDMGITSLAIEDREQPRPQNVSNGRCVGTRVSHRAACDPALEQSGNFQKFGEECQLTQRRRAAILVPANLEPPPRCVHPKISRPLGLFRKRASDRRYHPFLLEFRLTHWVTLLVRLKAPSALTLPQVQQSQMRKIGSYVPSLGPRREFLLGSTKPGLGRAGKIKKPPQPRWTARGDELRA
jgi:hypothetical protein